jgi:threonine dehydrogenase-like Zn-dependent dehydrogenase
VSVETVLDPAIQEPTDAIVRMTSTAICGSGLHLYDVLGMYLKPGDILGHEPMGIVEEVGGEPNQGAARAPRRAVLVPLRRRQHRLTGGEVRHPGPHYAPKPPGAGTGPDGYEIFPKKQDGCIKVVLRP